jgi:hypothetical protein
MDEELGVFHRLFLYVPEDSRFRFRLRVNPDLEQPGARAGPTAVISSPNAEPLGLCLEELGVTGYSRYSGETAEGPTSEYQECTREEIVVSLETQPLSRVAHVTLIAANTPIAEMKRRVASLRAKAGDSLQIEEPA